MGFTIQKEQWLKSEAFHIDGTVIIDGFVFVRDGQGRCFMVIHRHPDARMGGLVSCSKRTIAEHIQFINENDVENLMVCAENIEFIKQCQNLKYVIVSPASKCGNGFDYSPLYENTGIEAVSCPLKYGFENEYKTSIDYSRIKNLRHNIYFRKVHYAGKIKFLHNVLFCNELD